MERLTKAKEEAKKRDSEQESEETAPMFQPASTYAAGYQGSLSQSSSPYAPGLQAGIKEEPEKEKKKWKRGGPVSMGEEPEWLNMTSEEIGALHEQTVAEKNKVGEEIFQKTAASTVPTSAAASGLYTKPAGNPFPSSAAVSGTWKDPEAESLAELRQELVQKEDKVSELAGAQYHVRNREAKARLQEDKEAQASYDAALKLTKELDAVSKYLSAPSYYNGMDSLWQSKGEAVAKQYNTEDLEALRKELQAQKDQAVEALAAKGYDFDDMAGYDQMLRRREAYKLSQERFQREAEEHPFWSSLASILASPAQGVDYVRTGLNGVGHSDPDKLESYIPADVYDMYATNFVRTVRGTVAKKLAENPAFQTEIGGQNVYSFLYQTGMSMGDFLFNSLLTGSFTGGLAGTGSKASIEAAKNLSLAIMGTSAAANATAEAIERGLSNRQAYALGAIAGFAEVLTERFSLDALLDGKWEDGAVKYLLKNAFTEGTEEVGSDLINWAGDVLVSRDKSQWRQAVKRYEDRGYSEGEAFGLALRDQAQEMGMDLLGGILSGGLISGGNVVVNQALSKTRMGQTTNSMLEDVLASPEAMNELGVRITEDMTQSQKLAAVEDRLRKIAADEQATGKEKTASTGEVVNPNGLIALTEKEKANLSSGKRNKIISSLVEFKNFIRNALADGKNVDRAYLGKLCLEVVSQVKAETGIDVTNFNVLINGNDIRHIIKEHGNAATEEARGHRAVSPDDIALLTQVLGKPDKVSLSPQKDGKGRTVLVFEKQIGDKFVTMQGVSDGKSALETDTLYIIHKKQKDPQGTGHNTGTDTGPVINAQSAPPQGLSADIILPQENGNVNGQVRTPENGETHYSLKETARAYEGKDLSSDGSVYSYEFLTSLPDMEVTSLPEVGTVQGKDGRINARTVVNLGMMNAKKVGVETDGKVLIRNGYTGKQLLVTSDSIRHGLNGKYNRLLTNARLGTVIGDLVKNAVPVNALQNKAEGVTGTYAMAGYATDSKGREFVAIITVEQYSGNVAGLEVYDVTHAVSGRQKNGSQASTKLQGFYPIKATTISIAELLETVKGTHQSILSEDVLSCLGETRNPKGDYTDKVLFSMKDADSDATAPSAETQTENTQPLTQADAKRFATETGTEKGLVLDNYVQKHIRRETAERLNTLAQALGVRVRFVSSIRGGTANASIKGSEVQIERYNPNPVTYLLGHELTHRMQSLSPEAYTRFKESIRSEVEKEAQALHSLYRIRGEGIDFEGAMDEATANYAGRLLEEGPVLDEFIRRHKADRSILEKLLDAVRDMLSKLTGKERKQAETAEAKLLEAMEETAKKVKKNGGEVGTDSSVERFSLADQHIPTYSVLENVVHKEKAAPDGMAAEGKTVTLDQAVPNNGEKFRIFQENVLGLADNSLVSDETADQILQEQTMVGFLTRKGDLKLKKKMSQEQKRAAVRESLNRVIKRSMEGNLQRKIQGKNFAAQEKNDILDKIARFSALGGIQDGREKAKADKTDAGSNAGTSAKTGDRSGVQKEVGRVFESFGRMASPEGRGITDSSFGAQPVKAWVKDALVMPIDGSVAQEEQQIVQEFYIPSYVIQDEVWDKEACDAPAFASHGQIYFRASLPEEYRGTFGRHEIIHVMEQVSYQPYLDFIERVPELLNFETEEARNILRGAAEHCKIDLFNMDEADTIRLYDEINAILWGHIGSGKLLGLEEQVRRAFFDFDAYAVDLRSIYENFKHERQTQFG